MKTGSQTIPALPQVSSQINLSSSRLNQDKSLIDVGRVAHQASPIRFGFLRLLLDPYTLPAGNTIDP